MRVVHSLFLCYVVKLTYFTAGEGSDSFLVDVTWVRFLGSGFLRERWDSNVSTLYNDGQLCIYCLFIVDLYIKRNEYIIYLYITKCYNLVFEVGIEKQYFLWVLVTEGTFCCWSCVEQHLSGCFLSLSSNDFFVVCFVYFINYPIGTITLLQ